ncbi:MAG: hypothetical protein IKK11_01450 [Oscillospiraceae bacterium]|nr:hypothetical protein [Oscillospiraceae bacterium]
MGFIKSVGISYKRIVITIWAVLLVAATIVAACMALPMIPKYKKYTKGQEKAIEIVLADSDKFDDFAENNSRKSLLKEIYNFYNPQYVSYDILGTTYYNKEEVENARKLDVAFGEKLQAAGFACVRGSEFLRFSNFIGYATHYAAGKIAYAVTFGILLLVMLGVTVFCLLESQKRVALRDDALLCRTAFGKEIRIGLRKIQRVELAPLWGICIRGNDQTYTAFLIQNSTELHKAITGRMKALKQMRKKAEREDLSE